MMNFLANSRLFSYPAATEKHYHLMGVLFFSSLTESDVPFGQTENAATRVNQNNELKDAMKLRGPAGNCRVR